MNGSRQTLDASETVYLGRQLDQVRARSYEVQYPALRARSFVPVASDVDSTTETIIYEQFDAVGMAKIIASYADDLPRSDVKAKEYSARVKTLGSSYGYNVFEVRNSAKTGRNLPQRKANTSRKAIEELIERIAILGDTENGLLGLLNQPNATILPLPDGASTNPDWASKTWEEILADLFLIPDHMLTLTKQAERPDTMLLPGTLHSLILRTTIGDGFTSILNHFLATNPYIKNIDTWSELETAGVGGVSRIVCYRRDPDALELVIPQEFESLPVEPRNLEFVVNNLARIGGVLVYLPLSIVYADGG